MCKHQKGWEDVKHFTRCGNSRPRFSHIVLFLLKSDVILNLSVFQSEFNLTPGQ